MRNRSTVCRHWQTAILPVLAALVSVSCGVGSAQIGNTSANVTPASLSLNSSSLSFGNVTVGTSVAKAIALTNTSAVGGDSVSFSQVTVTGSGFTATTATLPIVLAPGASSTITIKFA